jgi:hypothetical protein
MARADKKKGRFRHGVIVVSYNTQTVITRRAPLRAKRA